MERLARRLERPAIQAIYSSPLERAVETATAIGKPHHLDPRLDEELGEFHAGEWEGLAIDDLDRREEWRRFNHFRGGTRAPGGELMIETQARMIRRVQALTERHPGETVAIVSHGDPLRAVVAHYLGIPLDLMLRFEISPASVSIVEVGEWGPRVLSVNERTGEWAA